MRTLFLTVDPAWPPVSGADLRNWQNAVAARALGPVTVASLAAGTGGTPPEDITCIALTAASSKAIWPPSASADVSDLRLPPEAAARFTALVRDFGAETVVIEHLALHPLTATARASGRRIILDMHNVESAAVAQSARGHFPLRPRRWLMARAAAQRVAAIERRGSAEVEAVWVCSTAEAERLRRAVPEAPPVHVVPNGIPRPASAPGALPPVAARNGKALALVFAGHLGYPPNVAAAQWLAERIVPAIRRRLPDARLVLAGRSPVPAVQRLAAEPGVSVMADPASMDTALADADLAVLPIRDGGGTRIKAIEAMSRGLPMIGTRLAVDGLGLADNVHFINAETTGEFVRAIVALAADTDAYARLRGAAWRHCLQNFGPSAIARAVQRGLAP